MKRPIPKLFRDWLNGELALWQDQNLIPSSQASAILALYETEAEATAKSKALAFYSLIGCASVLAGFSLLLVLGYNWDFFGYIPRLAILFGLIISFQAGSFFTRFFFQNKWLSETLAICACFVFGVAINLIGQTFNLGGKPEDGFRWWILGILPVAFLGQSPLLWTLVSILEIALFKLMCYPDEEEIWDFRPPITDISSGLYLFPLLLAPGFVWAFLKKCPFTLTLQALVLSLAGVILLLAWQIDMPVFLLATSGAGTAWAIGACYGTKFTSYLGFIGLALSAPSLIAFSYHEFQLEIFKEARSITLLDKSIPEFSIGVIPISLVIVPSLLFLRITTKNWKELLLPILFIAYLLLVTWMVFLAPYIPASRAYPFLSCLVANAILLVLSAKWMDDGWTRESTSSFFTGAALFFLWTILRYFDLFGDVGGMLGASALFLTSAMALIFLAIFWRRRKGQANAV